MKSHWCTVTAIQGHLLLLLGNIRSHGCQATERALLHQEPGKITRTGKCSEEWCPLEVDVCLLVLIFFMNTENILRDWKGANNNMEIETKGLEGRSPE